MTDNRFIAADAVFMVLYIGLIAGMASLSLLLLTFAALDIEFGRPQMAAVGINIAGWFSIPVAPRLYRWLVGHPFSWRVNGALGGMA